MKKKNHDNFKGTLTSKWYLTCKLYFDSEHATWAVNRQGHLIESISSEQLLNDPQFFDLSLAAEQWWGHELWEEFVC